MTDTITLNVELLDRTMRFAEAHAELCGMPACIARSAIVLDNPTAFADTTWQTRSAGWIETWRGYEPIRDYAVELLGLTGQQADLFFRPDNTLDDLRNIAATIKGDDQ